MTLTFARGQGRVYSALNLNLRVLFASELGRSSAVVGSQYCLYCVLCDGNMLRSTHVSIICSRVLLYYTISSVIYVDFLNCCHVTTVLTGSQM